MAIKLRTLGEKLLVGTSDLESSSDALQLSSPATRRTELAAIVERIQVYCDKLEGRLILSFDKFSRHKNFAGMRDCSRSLMLFYKGERLISHFLSSRPVFLESNPKTLEEEVKSKKKMIQSATEKT